MTTKSLHFTNGKIALRIFKRGGRVFAHRSDGDKREVLTAAQWDALEESWKRNGEPIDPHCCFTYYQLVAVGYPSNLEQLVRAL